MKLIFDIIKTGREFPSKKNYHFNKTSGIIGRSEEANWQLPDSKSYISNTHVEIEYKDGMYFIKDISTNGTSLKHPYRKLPKNMSIKINSTDIFIIGEYEIQARFMDNDYSQDDILSYKPENSVPLNQISSKKISNELIPDDFLLDDESVMSNSFMVEEEINYDNNVLNIFEEDNTVEHIDDLYDFEKEPLNFDNAHNIESVTNELKHEHIVIQTFEEKKVEKVEDKIIQESLSPVDNSKDNDIETKVIEEKNIIQEADFSGENSALCVLEEKLGIKFSNLNNEERDKRLNEIANIVINSLDGLKDSLETKDKIKKDLLIDDKNTTVKDNNPIRMGQYSLSILNEVSNNSIKLSEAVKKSFNELNIHNVALHRASKNLINIAVTKFSPKSLEHHFETTGVLNNFVPKKYQMWDSYIEMFNELNEKPDFGINLIAKDFTNEYKNIEYTIKLTSV